MINSPNPRTRRPLRKAFSTLHRSAAGALITGLALLTPLLAAAGSQIESGTATTALNATAHLNFKIIIPKVLYLHVASEDDRIADPRTVAVMSTGRDVMLNATIRKLEGGGSGTNIHSSVTSSAATPIAAPAASLPVPGDAAAGNLILTAAARKSIAENVPCTHGDAHPMARPPQGRAGLSNYGGPIICTASMP